MAKKAPSKKKAAKRAAKPKPQRSLKAAGKGTRAASRPKGDVPKSQALPGLGQGKHKKLDNICEGIAADRAAKNAATQSEQSYISSALQYMGHKELTFHRHAGVELSYIPGAGPKLRVKLTNEAGNKTVQGSGETASETQSGEGEETQFSQGEDIEVDKTDFGAGSEEQLH